MTYFYDTDVQEVVKQVRAAITHARFRADIAARLRDALEPYHGKKVDKRVLVLVEKALPELSLGYKKDQYYGPTLDVWSNEQGGFKNAFTVHLCEGTARQLRGNFDHPFFVRERLAQYLNMAQYANELENGLPNLPGKILKYDNARRAVEQAKAELGSAAVYLPKP